jgi:hypothetical protein
MNAQVSFCKFQFFYDIFCSFFLEHARELRIIVLRRKGFEPNHHPPKYKLQFILGIFCS